MSEIREHETSDSHDSSNPNTPTGLIGRKSQVVPGRFGEPLQVTHVQYSRGGGNAAPRRPLFLCLHGWGSNEADLADMMRYVAPYNDFASLRAPLVLQEAGSGEFGFGQGAYSWFHDCVLPAKIWIATPMLPPKPLTIGSRAMFPKIALWCRSVFRRVVCWRFNCCASIRNGTPHQSHFPASLLRESSPVARLPTVMSRS